MGGEGGWCPQMTYLHDALGNSEVRYASVIFYCDRAAIAEPVTPQWCSYLSI